MQRPALSGEGFDRLDVTPVRLCGECEAGQDAVPIEKDSTGATGALVASFLGAAEVEMLPQVVEQRDPGVVRRQDFHTVHAYRHIFAPVAGRTQPVSITRKI
ncbi:hypothetical protein M529_02915 [Sphingobium ummariense RL-3]|uniref:Uncharacterized protein n=1 Tax=Sphingobium ummariense RL-3 TaxID=1346791 RepID=T0KK91_9SPHN|nr:hypothetical protein M529_02915 [Sphingobium ummariense RL-3]